MVLSDVPGDTGGTGQGRDLGKIKILAQFTLDFSMVHTLYSNIILK
jgi:hypothetical protein